jgi:hypothetical protein
MQGLLEEALVERNRALQFSVLTTEFEKEQALR